MTAAEPPIPLNDVARGFWDRHHDRLRAAGVLTDADIDSFAMLSIAFATAYALSGTAPGAEFFREMVQYDRAMKSYQAFAREFGLTPKSRKQSKLNSEPVPEKDEFDL